jgi:hypothetical protein
LELQKDKLYDSLQNHNHIWIKKSRGIGVTEFHLKYIAWSCFSTYTPNTRVCIVTGPRIDLAEDLIASQLEKINIFSFFFLPARQLIVNYKVEKAVL